MHTRFFNNTTYKTHVSLVQYICNSCNTGTSGLPDMYTQGLRAADPRVYISGRPRMPVLQLLCNTSLAS